MADRTRLLMPLITPSLAILRWHDTHIANGILEGINSLVQAAKVKARGYRSSHNLKAMIYLVAGKLDALPST